MGFIFVSKKKQLIFAVKPRHVKSGVLWAKSIRDETVDTTGIFNSVCVIIGLSDQSCEYCDDNWNKQIGKKWCNCRLNLLGSIQQILVYFRRYFEELEIINDTRIQLFHENGTLKDHQPNVRNDYEDVLRPETTKY